MDIPPNDVPEALAPLRADRQRSRAVVAAFLLTMLTLLAFRAYAPQLTARPSEPVSPSIRAVDLNSADRTELMQVPGVGPERAEAILSHRETAGPFHRVEELDSVKGFGGKTVARARPFFTVGSTETPVETLERKAVATVPVPTGKIKAGERPIDVNTASVSELLRLPGVGPVLAQKIVDCRESKRFASVDDLRRVPRLGVKTLEAMRPFVVVPVAKESP